MNNWCQKNCLRYPQNCPENRCKCLEGCHAIGDFNKEHEGADTYCQYNCLVNPQRNSTNYKKNCSTDRCLCF